MQTRDGRGSVADSLLHELLQKGDSAHKYLQGSRCLKIDNWILLDNHVPPRGLSSVVRSKDSQKDSRRSKKHISMKGLKKAAALELPIEICRYTTFLLMHEMWKDCMKQLLRPVRNIPGTQTKIYHGLLAANGSNAVADCKMAVCNGVTGIMIRETGETFGIITADDKFQLVPKKPSVFILQVEGWKVALHGAIRIHPPSRGLEGDTPWR